jgi:glucose-1-phosphate adenylyltransferase
MRAVPQVLAMVLAGGHGSRLMPLTRDRAKPAVPFGGTYRLIDFALSNLANAGYRRVAVLTQYKSHSLDRHLALAWQFSGTFGDYVASVPAQMREGPRWFTGSADALHQNLNIIDDEDPDFLIVLSADHVYRMDPRQLVQFHAQMDAGVTVAAVRVPIAEASAFGVLEVDGSGRIRSFVEKPAHPVAMPGDPEHALVSMGNYVFSEGLLRRFLAEDAANEDSMHDIGGSLIPRYVEHGEAVAYDFDLNMVPGQRDREHGYWRDVGTLDAYYEANMDLVAVDPVFDLYSEEWPIHSLSPQLPPAKFVFEEELRSGRAFDSLVSPGVVVSGATVRRSIIGPSVRLHSGALVEDCVLFDEVEVGRGAIVRRAVIDKQVSIPDGAAIGVDLARDRERFTLTGRDVVVIGKRDAVV